MPSEPWRLTRDLFLSEPEVESLLSRLERRIQLAEPSERNGAVTDRLIIYALVFSGLRNSEFCRLRLADTVVGHGESAFRVRGTPRQDRMVYVPESLSRLVQEYVAADRGAPRPQIVRRRGPEEPLVVNERGRAYDRTALYRRVVRILTEAGFGERASVQFLRHTYGYLAYKHTSGNLLFIQRQMGHAHPMVSMVYAEFVEESYADLANEIGSVFAPCTGRRRKPPAGRSARRLRNRRVTS